MSKTIDTLVTDIYQRLSDGGEPPLENLLKFGANSMALLKKQMHQPEKTRPEKTLFASEIGEKCLRKLWYKVNYPNKAEALLPHVRIKFMYGDLLEQLVLLLAKEAGHTVEGEQEGVERNLLNGWKIRGRIDARIDGLLIDVKSTSEYGFKKFRDGSYTSEDPFGYMAQLGTYAGGGDAGFLAIDKTTGQLALARPAAKQLNEAYTALAGRDFTPLEDPSTEPERGYGPLPDRKSGRMRLCTECSYCAFKSTCWGVGPPETVSGKPVWFTTPIVPAGSVTLVGSRKALIGLESYLGKPIKDVHFDASSLTYTILTEDGGLYKVAREVFDNVGAP